MTALCSLKYPTSNPLRLSLKIMTSDESGLEQLCFCLLEPPLRLRVTRPHPRGQGRSLRCLSSIVGPDYQRGCVFSFPVHSAGLGGAGWGAAGVCDPSSVPSSDLESCCGPTVIRGKVCRFGKVPEVLCSQGALVTTCPGALGWSWRLGLGFRRGGGASARAQPLPGTPVCLLLVVKQRAR